MGEIELLEFNINYHVLVKLKDNGYKFWLDYINKLRTGREKEELDYLKAKANKDGYVEFQLWEFMQIFGESIIFGTVPIFETKILILKDEVTQYLNGQKEMEPTKDGHYLCYPKKVAEFDEPQPVVCYFFSHTGKFYLMGFEVEPERWEKIN